MTRVTYKDLGLKQTRTGRLLQAVTQSRKRSFEDLYQETVLAAAAGADLVVRVHEFFLLLQY